MDKSELVNDWSTFGDLLKEKGSQILVYEPFSCLKTWPEGQGRTDTGSLLPSFELVAVPSHK